MRELLFEPIADIRLGEKHDGFGAALSDQRQGALDTP